MLFRSAFSASVILPQMNRQPMCIWVVKPPFTQYISGKHNVGFAIGNAIATEINFQIEEGTGSVGIICWVESNGGIAVRLTDYNIPHTVSERDTLGKATNRAVSGTLAVIVTLLGVGLICTLLFLLRFM